MNLIAIAIIALGVVLLLIGLLIILRRRFAIGIAILLVGVAVAALPFLVSFYLAG